MGPRDTAWRALEVHPHFAAAMADYEPPMAPPHPDEARLDMNPLIDVSLVLLIFFILTATYEELRKKFPAPGSSDQNIVPSGNPNDIRDFTIRVNIRFEDGHDTYLIEEKPVEEDELQKTMEDWVQKTGHSKLAIEVDKRCSWKAFMKVQDAAAGAKIQEIIRLERRPPKQ